MRLPTFRFTAQRVSVAFLGCGLEHQVLGNVDAQSLAALLNADFLAIVLDLPMPTAEAFGAVLALADHRFPAAA